MIKAPAWEEGGQLPHLWYLAIYVIYLRNSQKKQAQLNFRDTPKSNHQKIFKLKIV